jgi:hypothetical protein
VQALRRAQGEGAQEGSQAPRRRGEVDSVKGGT